MKSPSVVTLIVLARWDEHSAQAYRIFVMGWPRPRANGWILWYPWLIQSDDRDRAADRSSGRLQDRTLTTQAASEETSSTRNLPRPPASR